MEWIKGKKKSDKWYYCSEVICLDTETSHNENICWITSIQVMWLGKYYLFRKPSELMAFYLDLADEYDLEANNRRIVTYIHNAAYDLSYLIPFFNEYLPGRSFSRKEGEHKYFKYSKGNFEWRCSYKLTNLSLDKWAEHVNAKHKKLVGFYDYSKVIYQDTPLTEEEMAYDREDVEVLQECLAKQMEMFSDDINSIPGTATGYVRRDIRKSCLKNKFYRKDVFLKTKLSYRQFRYCLKSFSGGYTHCNRHKRNQLITGNIKHRDFRSHYPSILKDKLFPMGKPKTYFDYMIDHRVCTIPEILGLWPQFCTISVIGVRNIHVKSDKISMPFLQESKMWISQTDIMSNKPLKERFLVDNGRVLSYIGFESNDEKYIDGRRYIIVDNKTLETLWEQYDFEEYFVIHVMKFEAGKLPKEVLDVVDKYYKDKSKYKKLHKAAEKLYGELNEMTLMQAALLLSVKQLLNSCYGCIATNPLKSVDEDEDINDLDIRESNEKKLERYYNSYYSVLPYQWATFVTGHARHMLYECIKLVGYENVLYADTDSLFYISNDEIEANLLLYNKSLRASASYVKMADGEKIYYSSFDPESDVKAFKGLHSKCYGYVTDRDELKLTIAGVPARTCIGVDKDKKPIYVTREQELAGKTKDPVKALDKLSDKTVFKINTGTTAEWITLKHPVILDIDGHEIETAGGCIIRKLAEKKISESHVDKYEGEENPNNDFSDVMIF